MRTGAIFARGSCRALKWMALVGMVFALGAVDAAAQDQTLDATFDSNGVKVTVPESVEEGDRITVTVQIKGEVAEQGTPTASTVTVTVAVAAKDLTTSPDITAEDEDVERQGVVLIQLPAGPEDDSDAATSLTTSFDETRTIPIRTYEDDDEAEDEVASLSVTLSGALTVASGEGTGEEPAVRVTIEDDETQEVQLTEDEPGKATESATPIELTLKTKYTPVDDTITVVLNHGDHNVAPRLGGSIDGFELSLTSQVLNATDNSVDVTLTGPANDGDREETTATVEVTAGSSGTAEVVAEDLDVVIEDAHMLPSVMVKVTEADAEADAEAVTTLTEGEDYTLMVMLVDEEGEAESTDVEDLEVMLSLGAGSADESDYRLQPASMVTIAQGESSGELTLLVLEDLTDINPETLVLNAQVSGDDDYGDQPGPLIRGVVNLPIGDETTPTVTPKSQTEINQAYMDARDLVDDSNNMWRPGDRALMIDLNELFNLPAAGYDADATSDDMTIVTADADADPGAPGGGVVTVAPKDDGSTDVHVTVSTGTSSATIQLTATSARATFRATVDPPPPPTAKRGQLTSFKLMGGDVEEKTIAGVERYHVPEGAQDVYLQVEVTWTHEEIAAIGYGVTQDVYVRIMSDRYATSPPSSSPAGAANWLSWIDDEGDVHFPRSSRYDAGDGNLGGWIQVTTPTLRQVPEAERGSKRHTKADDGTIDVLVLHDNHEAENDAFYIEAVDNRWVDIDVGDSRPVNRITPEVVIEDDEEQTVTVKMGRATSSTVYEGDSGDDVPVFTVAAKPERYDLPLEVRVDMVDLGGTTVARGEISLSKSLMVLNEDRRINTSDDSDTVTLHLPESDGNRKDNDYELHASVNDYSVSSGGYETISADPHPITVIDVHKLPWLTVDPESGMLTEGAEPIELTLTLDRNPKNTRAVDPEKREYTSEPVDVMVDMLPEGIKVMPRPVKFPKYTRKSGDNWEQKMKVEVTAVPNDELDGERMVPLTFEAAGTIAANGTGSGDGDYHMAVATLTVEDGTTKLVWARSPEEVEAAVMAAKKEGMGDDMMFTAGEMIELEGNDLFGSAEGVSVGYSAMVEGDAVSYSESGGVFTITADSMGMAKVTITARASRPSGAVTINDQTDPREASITVALEVGLVALSIMLSGPEDGNMNIVEGGMGGMVTATANRAVTEDTVVNLMRDRAMSSAEDADFTAEPITIMAGQMKGSTMVMAVEDDMMENEGNMTEELVLYGMAADNAGEVTGHVKFYLWDAAVPALPVIAQLLLAAFLAIGGYRRYRRR